MYRKLLHLFKYKYNKTMKRFINTIAIFAAAAALLSACQPKVEESEQYLQLQSRIDSLNKVNKQLKANYNETLDILNDIEAGFSEISTEEHNLVALSLETPTDTVSLRDELANKLDKVKSKIDKQQERINNLQAQLSKSNAKNKTLTATIGRLQQELDEKTNKIMELQNTIKNQNIRIDELGNAVASLEKDVAGLKDKNASQQLTISSQDARLNTVSYICGTEAELIEWGLFEKKGLFDSGRLLDLSRTAADFKSFDRRRVGEIPTNGHKIKLLTPHPDDSYTIEPAEDGTESIMITDREHFWSISKFLVVRVKR